MGESRSGRPQLCYIIRENDSGYLQTLLTIGYISSRGEIVEWMSFAFLFMLMLCSALLTSFFPWRPSSPPRYFAHSTVASALRRSNVEC